MPHSIDLTASINALRSFGRTRPTLLRFSGRPLREVFLRFFPLPCTHRQLSGEKGNAYLFPSMCFYESVLILTKEILFVKGFQLKTYGIWPNPVEKSVHHRFVPEYGGFPQIG